MKADLHTHSYMSDGTLSPREVVRAAHDAGVELLALTDHDSFAGCLEAADEGKKLGVTVISGIEIDTWNGEEEIHMLGLDFDMENAELCEALRRQMEKRAERTAAILKKLRALGYDVSQSELSCRGTMTRLTIANLLVKNGFATDRSDAFKRLIGAGKPAYADFERIDSEEAIRLINGAGGISVIAHPCKMHGNPHAAIAKLADAGLWGVEAFYPSSTQGQKELFISIAAQNGLRTTCGSDFHGANRPNVTVGMSCEPSKLLDKTASEIMRRREHKMLTK